MSKLLRGCYVDRGCASRPSGVMALVHCRVISLGNRRLVRIRATASAAVAAANGSGDGSLISGT